MSIWSYLGFKRGMPEKKDELSRADSVREIVPALDRLEPEKARFIAAFAYLLSRVAHADLDISSQETRAMEELVADHAGLHPSRPCWSCRWPVGSRRSPCCVAYSPWQPRIPG